MEESKKKADNRSFDNYVHKAMNCYNESTGKRLGAAILMRRATLDAWAATTAVSVDIRSQKIRTRTEEEKIEFSKFFSDRGYCHLHYNRVTDRHVVDCFYKVIGDSDSGPDVVNYCTFSTSESNEMEYLVVGGPVEEVKVVIEKVARRPPPTEFVVVTLPDKYGKLKFENKVVVAPPGPPKQSFYPFLPKGVDDLIDDYFASSSNVLVIFGPPGTGKSTFARRIAAKVTGKTLLCYDQEIYRTEKFTSLFSDATVNTLILEDVDIALRKRTEGNGAMSTLLNSADGIVREKAKIVISTNLENLNDIDPALLRPGRCYSAIHFRELSEEEAIAACKEANVPFDESKVIDGKVSLASILNPVLLIDVPPKKSFGFAPPASSGK